MRILVRQHAFPLQDDLRVHAVRRANVALGRFAERIDDVTLRFAEPHGGDKVCRLHLGLHGRRPVHIEERAAEIEAAVDVACDRAARVVARQLRKR